MGSGYALPTREDLWYIDLLNDAVKSGTQIDIAFIGGGDIAIDWYMQAYKSGLTEPLDALFQTDTGKVIYEKYPEKIWNSMRIYGEIHGIFTNITKGYQYGYDINPSWYAKNKTINDSITNELSSLISIVPEEEPVYIMTSSHVVDIASMFGYSHVAAGVVLNSDSVLSIFESESLRSHLRDLRYLYEQGHIGTKELTLDESYYYDIYWGASGVPEVFIHNEGLFVPVTHPWIDSENAAVSVMKDSKYKEESLTLLSWLLRDRDLADLLLYGVEGIHHKKENGIVYPLEGGDVQFSILSMSFMGLFHSATPCFPYYAGVSELALDYMEGLQNSFSVGFRFDTTGYQDDIAFLDKLIYDELTEETTSKDGSSITYPVFSGADPDWELKLAQLNEKLADAGIDRLIAEVERQYYEWKELYSSAR
jgi:putative aldouronate transport system substrate-binding protein